MRVETEIGAVDISWGINRWVLVEASGSGLQHQVSKQAQLVALLIELGLDSSEAEETASEFWRTRPAEAGLRSASQDEGLRSATALPAWAVLAILLGVVALFVATRLLVLPGRFP